MSNSFPAVPADLALASIEYDVAFPAPGQAATGLTFTGVTPILAGMGAFAVGSLALFVFDTPGSFGTFDQTTAETALAALVTDACQFLADASGEALAAVQASVTVTRRWTWTDATANRATYADTMAYPPAA